MLCVQILKRSEERALLRPQHRIKPLSLSLFGKNISMFILSIKATGKETHTEEEKKDTANLAL